MTRKNLLDLLETYQTTKKRIDHLEEEIYKYKSLAISLGDSIGSGMPGSHNSGNARYTKAIENLTDVEEEHLKEISNLKESLDVTKRYIDLEKKPHRRLILQMRYIDGLSVSKIAIETDRSNKTIYKLYNTSIKNILSEINNTGA